MWPKTEAQGQLLATAETLAAQFAVTAPHHDREGSFPFEHFEAMRECGYFASAVPREFGGAGHGLTDVALAQVALGRGDGSTALSVGMHHMVVGTEAATRRWPEPMRERIFREVVTDGALLNNIAAEPEMGSPRGGGRPMTSVVPDGSGRWRLNGRKTFSTLSPVLTYALVYVSIEDGSGQVGRVMVRCDQPGVRIEETWDALGMRATGSHDMVFEDVPVTDDEFTQRRQPGAAVPGAHSEAWFPLLVAAANLGVAEAARDYAVRYAQTRQPTGAPHPIAQIPHVREEIGRMQAALVTARVMLLTAAEDWEQDPEPGSAASTLIPIAKRLVTNTAVEVTDTAMRVVGGVALHRSEPLERFFRDARSGLVNPPIEARALDQIAASVLDRRED